MRLVCPNCDAEYEVDDTAIPRTGRDVQCSNCGHAWFQTHPEMVDQDADDLMPETEAVSAEEAYAEDGPDAAPVSGGADRSVMAAGSEPETTARPDGAAAGVAQDAAQGFAKTVAPAEAALGGRTVAPPAPEGAAVKRNIDESVLAVLREEAAREVAARRAESPALETQTEMRLAPSPAPPAASAVVARLKGEPEPVAPTTVRPRRELLPAIEEINSTLRASSGRPGEEDSSLVAAEAAQAARNRFGSGFMTLVLLAVILLAIYVLAPLISQQAPALAGVLSAYVAAVDAARVWLDSQMRSLIGMLRGLAGVSQG